MGKREDVKKPRLSRDYYPTIDPAAVEALKPFLYTTSYTWGQPAPPMRYIEPCAGDGSLIRLLASGGVPVECVGAYDIDPQGPGITQRNCLTLRNEDLYTPYGDLLGSRANCFITNPPFDWRMLQPILDKLPTLLPTWLLLPADTAHNKRMSPYLDFCTDIVSVGRLYWFADEKGKFVKGVDNFVWYKFDASKEVSPVFHPRQL